MKAQNTHYMRLWGGLMCLVLSLFILLNPQYNTVTISYLIIGVLCVALCFVRSRKVSTTESILLYSSCIISLFLLYVNQYTDLLGFSLLTFFSVCLHKEISAKLLWILLVPIMAILVLKSVFFIQIPGLSNLNGFYVNTSVLVMCLSIVKRGKINLAMLILLIAFTILFLVIKSRLGFIATCSLLVFKAFDHFKNKRFKVMSILIFLSALIPLLILKKVSITGRMQINTLIANHVDSLQLFDYNPFTNWYSHTIVNHNAIDVSQVIGEVYNVAFNDYLQILVQYGILPFLAFLALNVYLLYILLRRKKGLYTVCFLIINLMLLTSYPFFIPASLFFLMLFYFEITKKEQLFQLKHTLTKSVLMHSLSFKITTVLLLITLGSVYYYPKYVLFQESEKSTSINELLDSQLTKHAFRNHEIKYWVAKEFISKDPKNAKNTFVYLNDKYLSYNLLLFTAESFERLGDYKEASIYYKKAHVIRPFSLMPVYKQLLISDHLNQKKEVQELLSYYKTMELRIDNEYTDIMTREINQILKKYES